MRKTLFTACFLLISAVAVSGAPKTQPSGKILFHEDWSNHLTTAGRSVRIGTETTAGVWTEVFSDNTAWVVRKAERCTEDPKQGRFCVPSSLPERWDAPNMRSLEPNPCSVWLPFGNYGLNGIRHDFKKPYPTVGALDTFIWVKNEFNMRGRGVTLILDTTSGKEAKIAFGMWAGTTSPSYKIEGLRTGQTNYDDGIYHRLREIELMGKGEPPTCADTWNDFVIDVGKTSPGKLTFRYRNHMAVDADSHSMSLPLELIPGKDYLGVKAIVIGSLPWAAYTGDNATGDNMVFIGDVWFSVPADSSARN